MSLQFYIGRSGAGKTHAMYSRIIEEAKVNTAANYVVLVHEQSTMQAQKQLVTMHPDHGILNIDVLSFERLAYRVFDEVGADKLPVLDDIGKLFLIQKSANNVREDLIFLGSGLRRLGFVKEIKSFITEMIQYDYTVDRMGLMLEACKKGSLLSTKLSDMRKIYTSFQNYIKDNYITAEETPLLLSEVLERSECIKDSVFVVDGYTGFTPLQMKVMEKLMLLCREVRVAVTCDAGIKYDRALPEHSLFYMSAKMMNSLAKIAKDNDVEILESVLCTDNFRFNNNEQLMILERNIFGNNSANSSKGDAISIAMCKNYNAELEYAARQIRRMVIREGYRFKDIAIVVGSTEGYMQAAERIFADYDIPVFVDYKKSILINPAIEFIRALMEIVINDFSYESVIRLLRTGLTGLETDDIDILDNYLVASGFRGKRRWKTEWEKPFNRISDEEIAISNELREKIICQLLPFADVFGKKNTVLEKTGVLVEILEKYEIQQQLKNYEIEFMNEGSLALAKEYAQVYRVIINTFDKLVELMGDEVITAKEYKEILEAGLSGVKIGVIPPGVDQVTVGDLERSRLKDVRALFVLGVNDGLVPKQVKEGGILSGLEREQLKSNGIELAPGGCEQYYMQQFYLYLNLTHLQDRLFITFSKSDAAGKAVNPSYLIRDIMNIFPDINIIDDEEEQKNINNIVSSRNAMEYIIANWKDRTGDDFVALYNYMIQRDDLKEQLIRLKTASLKGNRTSILDKELMLKLYGGVLEGSVTRLEKYSACAYSHFLNYGLRLMERDKFGFDSIDTGNIFHGIP